MDVLYLFDELVLMVFIDFRILENFDFNDKYSWVKVFWFMGYVVEIGLLVCVIMNVNLVNVVY